jgi:gliding motility-associated-like protein
MLAQVSNKIKHNIMSAKSLFKFFCILAVTCTFGFSSKAQLAADFTTTTPTSGCGNPAFIVSFKDISTGGAVSWEWYFGNNPPIFLQNPSFPFPSAGLYSVKLIVRDAAGNPSTKIKTDYIEVFAKPTVAFTGVPTTGCVPLTVQFTDNSIAGAGSNSITNWLWDFGNSATPPLTLLQNPIRIYDIASTFNVTLTVTNSKGCSNSFSKPAYISTFNKPVASFTSSAPIGCSSPQTINFTNTTAGAGPYTYQWDFNYNGTNFVPDAQTTPNPSHSYTTGTYTVKFVVKNSINCTDTFTAQIVIGSLIANFTAPLTACVGKPINIVNTTLPAPTTVDWDFGDLTTSTVISPTKTYNTAGIYTIKLKSFFGTCQDTKTQNIEIFANPSAAFTASPLTACKPPLAVTFTATTTGAAAYEWHFGDAGTSTLQNPTHTYTSYGAFTDTLIITNANGCKDTVIKIDHIKIVKPIATIVGLPVQGCAPLSHTFVATVNSNDPVVGYEWFKNNVLFSTLASPTEIFAAGTYNIKLVITMASGCTDTAIVLQGVKAGTKPVANFVGAPREACAKIPIQFTDLSTGNPDYWKWDFLIGQGSSSSQNPTKIFEDTGFFSVQLIVGNNGCFDTLLFTNYIHILPPIAIFSFVPNCINRFERTFIDASIGADTWAWDFGPGQGTSNSQNPTHIFTLPGTYQVSLTVTNAVTGCNFTKILPVVIANEFALFTASKLEMCKKDSTVFTATSINPISQIVSYHWYFGDGSDSITAANIPITHQYTTRGNKTVKLVITDVNGCKDSLTKVDYIKVYGPLADFVAPSLNSCLLTNINFTDLSTTDGIHAITPWTWTFGDNGNNSIDFAAPPFIHQYTATGTYTVKLKVKDSYGCLDSITKQNYITITAPVAKFTAVDTISCRGKIISFINSSTGVGNTYKWNFGDPLSLGLNTSTDINPTHIFNQDNLYTITLVVTDANGCTDTLRKIAYIKIANPVALFTVVNPSGLCPPVAASFINNSSNAISYVWTFGDGPAPITSTNASHTYNTAGTFVVTLVATSPGGCTDTFTFNVVVQGPKGTFTYDPIAGCSPLVVNFTPINIISVDTSFLYGDGAYGKPLSHIYKVQPLNGGIVGDYLPTMILKDAAGCEVFISGTPYIRVKGVIPSFTQDTFKLCGSGNVAFTSTFIANDPVTSYEWNFGDLVPGTSTLPSPTYFYPTTGLFYPKLRMKTALGCIGDTIAPVPTRVVKIPDIVADQPGNKCSVASYSFFAANLINPDTSAITWKWKFTSGTTIVNATGINPTNVEFAVAGVYLDTLIAINSTGCRDTAYNSFTVYPKPIIDAGVDTFSCKGVGVKLIPNGGLFYTWLPPIGLSCNFCPTPTANPDVLTEYTVEGTSVNGCKNTDKVIVDVINPFIMQSPPDANICEGSSIILRAAGGNTYTWSPSAGLSATSGNPVTAKPDTTTIYTLIGVGAKGCFSDTATIKLTVFPIPVVNGGPDRVINVGETITLVPILSPDITEAVWTPSLGIVNRNYPSITIKPNINTTYTVTVKNPAGCTAVDIVNIRLLCNDANIFMPNTFSPNGDGNNDIFYPRGKGVYTIKQLRIYDRWGEEVFARYLFTANDLSKGWDGTFKGKTLQPDVYVYMMDVQCDNGETTVYKGNVALIK